MNIQIEKQIDDLTIERFRFTTLSNGEAILYLDSYFLLQKENKRMRNYKVLKRYERLSGRDSTITEDEIPLTAGIKAEAIEEFISKIKVLKWSERKIYGKI